MPVDAWIKDSVAGVPTYSGQESRLALGAAFAHVGNSVGARSGIIPAGTGTELLVTANGTPNMTVNVAVGQAVVQGSTNSTQGPYVYTLDTAKTGLTIAAANASNPRIDLVAVQVKDQNVIGTGLTDDIVVITGTPAASPTVPALPTDASYLPIARVSVPAADTTIDAGQITYAERVFTTGVGGVLPCLSTARPGSPHPGMVIFETDTRFLYFWNPTAAAWKRLVDEDEVGLGMVGYAYAASGTSTPTNGAVTETGLATAAIPVKAGRRYRIRTRIQVNPGTGSAFARANIVTSPVVTMSDFVISFETVAAGQNQHITAEGHYVPAADNTLTFKPTVQVSGSSTASTVGGHWITVEDLGV